jgi:hypothetical protein
MEQVYQDTICVQPLIIASRNQPTLVELKDFDEGESLKSDPNNTSGAKVSIDLT